MREILTRLWLALLSGFALGGLAIALLVLLQLDCRF